MRVKEWMEQMDKISFEVHNRLFNHITKDVEPKINKSHIFLLKIIKNKENCTVTDIANHMDITLSAVTNLVNKLYEMGLVTRLRSERDRRIVYVGLTEEGKNVLKKIEDNRNRLFEKYFSDLSEEEIVSFFKTIEKITSKILI